MKIKPGKNVTVVGEIHGMVLTLLISGLHKPGSVFIGSPVKTKYG